MKMSAVDIQRIFKRRVCRTPSLKDAHLALDNPRLVHVANHDGEPLTTHEEVEKKWPDILLSLTSRGWRMYASSD